MFKKDCTALIIDDDLTTIRLIAETLASEFEVSFSLSARKGIEMAKQEPSPDVILLDVMMPEISGFDVCRELKSCEETQDIPVLFVSALSDVKNHQLGFELGASDFVTKPIVASLLKARVKTHAKYHKQLFELEQLAATDALTGCVNRRKFDEALRLEWLRATRTNEPLTIMMLDVDNFKAYNDHYGHGRGDECLISVGKLLRHSANRANDVIARIGGEEFALILPNTNRQGASKVAFEIIKLCQQVAIPHEYSEAAEHVTVSIGAGVFSPSYPLNAETTLDKVDAALYEAKENGKNQVKFVDPKQTLMARDKMQVNGLAG